MIDNDKQANITKEDIDAQLQNILKSPQFCSSNRLGRFLEYVIAESSSGRSENIKAYNIAIQVFDRNENFDPQADPIVRIYAGRLRKALKEYYSNSKKNAIIIEIPKGSYKPKFTKKPARGNGLNSYINKKKLTLYLGIILISFTGILIGRFNLWDDSKKTFLDDDFGRTAIEIIPFQNLSTFSENTQFSLRLVEQTEMALSQFSIVLFTKGSKNESSTSKYSLLGSVKQENEKLRVIVKLRDNKTGILVFSKEYIENLSTVATSYIEDVFANKIAVDLADEFGELQKFRLRNSQNNGTGALPHEAVLSYYDYLTHMNKNDNEHLISEIEKTAKTYPNYAPIWAAISGLYMDKYKHFQGNTEDLKRAKETAEKAEIINPMSWHVQNHLAQVELAEGNLNKFYEAVERQMKLNSNSTMTGQVGLWLCLIGNIERGIPLIEEAKLRNPYYPRFFHFGNALQYIEIGNYEQAYEASIKVRMPELYWDPLFRAGILGHLNRIDEAKLALEELLTLRPDFSSNGQESMARALYSEKYQKNLLDGLLKAGLVLK